MMTTPAPVYKNPPDKRQRRMRFVRSILDPRAWLHLLKMVNYYNYGHVVPLREMTLGRQSNISFDANFTNPHNIVIGKRVRIGSRCHIWAGPLQGRIRIGDDVLFGPEVMLTAATYDIGAGEPISEQPMREGDIVIGDDVWLATRALILPGVTIGRGAVIAAGAVVKTDAPDFAIVAGSPARIVGERRLPDRPDRSRNTRPSP
ncbi:acyltransferase [Aurantiacibacter spongiae]|uniref:Acyltransferase n=1 Tax=Aurantiacibacter spongiae TaxID=2488860 RepID=A0A3N5DQX3_9SPHN|nr:acyltransferase [Aurantiacibacter spongiae]RPF71521.1 acyltransferase [Aurantiacibacter spongiae]